MTISRRAALKGLGCSGAASLLHPPSVRAADVLTVAGRPVELQVAPVGDHIVRISLLPLEAGKPRAIPATGSLVEGTDNAPVLRVTDLAEPRSVACGQSRVSVLPGPLVIRIERSDGSVVQDLKIDERTGGFSFRLGDGPILGLGEGGRQFDRRGSVDNMRSGQGGYALRTHGGRVPVPWLIGTAGWAMFVHQPSGTFDLSKNEGMFTPARAAPPLPLDIFIVTVREPARIMAEYARLTGLPEIAAALVARLSAIAPNARLPRARTFDRQNFSREEAPLRRADLSGDRILPVGLEYGPRLVLVQPHCLPRPQADARRASQDAFSRGAARRHPRSLGCGSGKRSLRSESRRRITGRKLLERPSKCLLAGS